MELKRLSREQFEEFRAFIYKNSGIRVDEHKVALLSNRIRRRLKAGDFEDFDAYYRHLTSPRGADELVGFLDAITTNETFFFRTQKHFDWLANDLIPALVVQQRAGERLASLRIWSAGCANGAEPYSIAICLSENTFRLRDWSLKIIATDLSEEMLRAARAAIFTRRAIASVSEQRRRRHFQHLEQGDLWRVKPGLRQFIEFKRNNLMQPLATPAFDCIFIRNVLIYFDAQSKQVVINNLIQKLAPGGYLVVGPSEGVFGMLSSLQRISPTIYQKVDGPLIDRAR